MLPNSGGRYGLKIIVNQQGGHPLIGDAGISRVVTTEIDADGTIYDQLVQDASEELQQRLLLLELSSALGPTSPERAATSSLGRMATVPLPLLLTQSSERSDQICCFQPSFTDFDDLALLILRLPLSARPILYRLTTFTIT